MNASEFVKYWKAEKDSSFELYTSGDENTQVSALIKKMQLSPEQKEMMASVIDAVLTDTYYSLLLGLDGAGSIGGMQKTFKILDESGSLVSDCGEIEAEAWEQFQSE